MQRTNWTFEYSTIALKEGAEKKIEHHKARLKFWEEAKEKVMKEVRESGIEVSESEAGSSYSNMGREPKVMVRSDLQVGLTECHRKIGEHQGKITEYEGWVQVLGAQTKTLHLNAEDFLYFFGK